MKSICAILVFGSNLALAAVPGKLTSFPEGERLLYSRLVEAFRRNQLSTVVQQRQLLEKNYPKSVHLDNAYYLTGMLEFQNGMYGEAVRDFNKVTDLFPKSNKRPSALFALAATYDRLGLKPQAVRVYQSVIKDYPGSPESQRAWMQLQLEKATPKKK